MALSLLKGFDDEDDDDHDDDTRPERERPGSG
jgi:hypothetical protein